MARKVKLPAWTHLFCGHLIKELTTVDGWTGCGICMRDAKAG